MKTAILLKHGVAFFIDLMALGILYAILKSISGQYTDHYFGIIWLGYFIVLPLLSNGKTLGKATLKMRIVREKQIKWMPNILFYIFRLFLSLLLTPIFLLPLTYILFDDDNRTFHDFVLKSNIRFEN
jgi:uncharacterized RDD family membrane protein YckC